MLYNRQTEELLIINVISGDFNQFMTRHLIFKRQIWKIILFSLIIFTKVSNFWKSFLLSYSKVFEKTCLHENEAEYVNIK